MHNGFDVCRNAFFKDTKIPLFCIENSGICFVKVRVLLFPVVPDAFECAIVSKVMLPDSVTQIGEWAFFYSGIEEMVLPSGLEEIADAAFQWCNALKSIVIPEGVVSIGRQAFLGCEELESVSLPSTLTSIDAYAFSGTDLSDITIPQNVKTMGHGVFQFCYELESVTFECSAPLSFVHGGNANEMFYEVTATIHYPENDPTWDSVVGKQFGGDLTWVGYKKACEHNGLTEVRNAKEATCTETGYIGDVHCVNCGEKLSGGEVIAVKDHTFGEWEETKAPTCTEKGSERRDCANCDHFETRDVDAKGHDHKPVVTAPTCTDKGYTTHTCECGDSYKDTYVDPTGHSMGAWTVVTAPTENEKGSERRECANCDYFETREVDVLISEPGDLNGDESVNDDDVILLLWHTLLPDLYPVSAEADFTGDGFVNDDDVILLLWHTLLPDLYPI